MRIGDTTPVLVASDETPFLTVGLPPRFTASLWALSIGVGNDWAEALLGTVRMHAWGPARDWTGHRAAEPPSADLRDG